MKRSNRLFMLIGVLLAVMGTLGAIAIAGSGGSGGAGSAPTATPEATTTVVVAKQDINLGDKITADMVEAQTVTISQKANMGSDTYTLVNEVVGMTAGGKITQGQPLHSSSDILTPGVMPDGKSIAGAIKPGMVAISMEVDQVNGVGTIIVMNDYVNVIVGVETKGVDISYKNKDNNTILDVKGQTEPSVKMVIQNRKVLGTIVTAPTGENTAAPAAASGAPAPAKTSQTVSLNGRHMVVILEVKPSEAEVIRWAQRAEISDPQNYISMALVLRSEKDGGAQDVQTTGVTFKMLVDKWGVLPVDARAYVPTDLMQIVTKLAVW